MLKCSMIILIWIDYSCILNLCIYLVFWTTLPASRGLYSMKKPREFVHNKCKTLFIISWHFWTNIEYSHSVPTYNFFRNYAPVKVNPDPPHPGINAGISLNIVQKATNAPPCGAGNSRKCPTPGATENVPVFSWIKHKVGELNFELNF